MEEKEGNKQIAVNFLNLVTKGKIDEAYEKYVDIKGKHHNIFFPKGFNTLKQGMKENEKTFPNKKFTIKNILSDSNMVAVHSHLILKKGMELITVHLFRINNNKIIEMWDCGQQIPENMSNKDGAF